MKYIKGLDSLRAMAVLLVLLWHGLPHFATTTTTGRIQHFLVPSGVFGVNFFFVLSGFLITSILLEAKKTSENRGLVVRNFMARRVLRLFPVYYLFVALLYLLGFPTGKGDLVHYLTYTVNFAGYLRDDWLYLGHTWSLCVEEQFYLLWPFALLYTPTKFLKLVIASFIGITLFFCVAFRQDLAFASPKNVLPFFCFDAFGLGALYACFRQDNQSNRTPWLLGVFAGGAFVLCLFWNGSVYLGKQPIGINFLRTAHSLIALWLINAVVTAREGWVKRRIIENRVLIGVGKISYGIYLFHPAVSHYAKKLPLLVPSLQRIIEHPFASFLVETALTIALAYLSFRFVETPFLKLKPAFAYARKQKRNERQMRPEPASP